METLIVSFSVAYAIFIVTLSWKFSEFLKKKIFLLLWQKEEHTNIDIELLSKLIIAIALFCVGIAPLLLLLSYLDGYV